MKLDNTRKPTVLVILSTVCGPDDTPEWRVVRSKFNILIYDCKSIDEFCERLKPGGPYSRIDAIFRTGWLKVGPYAEQKMFSGKPIDYFPPSLRFITCSGHGYDAADIPALTARGIAYANTPDTCTEPVANTALHLILNTYRYFTLAEHVTRQDRWDDSRMLCNMAVEPTGQVLGVVGLGDIGLAIARKAALAFDMRIAYHNRVQRPELEAKLPDGATYYGTVDELLEASDCICLACPLVPETKHLLSQERLGGLPPEKRLRVVNIGRGQLIDEDALLEAMNRGTVIGVGLDVHANEPGVNPQLKDNYATTLLPHIGVCSGTSWANFDRVGLVNLTEFFYGDLAKVKLVNRQVVG
ncbi:glyoxylate reductase [Thozetella sp. PMI_491]|nr:glyoxylate reductase [Thozetella sp. PMI_491]